MTRALGATFHKRADQGRHGARQPNHPTRGRSVALTAAHERPQVDPCGCPPLLVTANQARRRSRNTQAQHGPQCSGRLAVWRYSGGSNTPLWRGQQVKGPKFRQIEERRWQGSPSQREHCWRFAGSSTEKPRSRPGTTPSTSGGCCPASTRRQASSVHGSRCTSASPKTACSVRSWRSDPGHDEAPVATGTSSG